MQDERGPRKSTIEKRAALREPKQSSSSKSRIAFQPWRDNTPPPMPEISQPTAEALGSAIPMSMNPQSMLDFHGQMQKPFGQQYPFLPVTPMGPRLSNFTPSLSPGLAGAQSQLGSGPMSANPGNFFGYTNPASLLHASMFLQAMHPMRLPNFKFFNQQLPNIAPTFLNKQQSPGKIYFNCILKMLDFVGQTPMNFKKLPPFRIQAANLISDSLLLKFNQNCDKFEL